MVIVTLEDSTRYYIDTDKVFNAESIVRYKLRNFLDYRNIKSIEVLRGVKVDKEDKYYNSDSAYDGVKLIAAPKITISYK
ncbi:hypothetical protein [Paraclostridium dentum]|uniref:hypothetical protein n=1 Tax=Paraclostridium dentum TaxID=2662455 RepID=UPI003F2D2DCE